MFTLQLSISRPWRVMEADQGIFAFKANLTLDQLRVSDLITRRSEKLSKENRRHDLVLQVVPSPVHTSPDFSCRLSVICLSLYLY